LRRRESERQESLFHRLDGILESGSASLLAGGAQVGEKFLEEGAQVAAREPFVLGGQDGEGVLEMGAGEIDLAVRRLEQSEVAQGPQMVGRQSENLAAIEACRDLVREGSAARARW